MKCTVTFKTATEQCHRFHAISALSSAASPEKMDKNTKLRTTSGTINIHQQSSPFGHQKYRGDIIIKGNKTNGVNRLNSVQKATNLKKKTKVGINEKYSCC